MFRSIVDRTISLGILFLIILTGACASDSNGSPPPDAGTDALPPVLPPTVEQIHEACIRMHACGVQRHPRLGDCVNNYHDVLVRFGQQELADRSFGCVNQSEGDCKLIRECMGFAGKPSKSCSTDYVPKCVGDVAHTCDLLAKWERKVDCTLGGLECAVKQVGTTSDAFCGGGECNPDEIKATCKDNKLFQCVGGAFEIDDCPAQGLQCRDPVKAICEGKGRSCREFAPECQGNTVVKCESGYVYELTCRETRKCDPTNAICVPAGSECNTDSFFDKCEGDKLTVCVDGFKKTFDCKALGFLGCEVNKSGHGDSCKAAPVYE